MDIFAALNIGSIYQNIAFYGFLIFLVCINLDVLKYLGKQKQLKSAIHNH